MKRKVIIHFMLIILMMLFLIEVAFFFAVRQYYYNDIKNTLVNHAATSTDFYNRFLQQPYLDIEQQALDMLHHFAYTGTELQVIDRSGKVWISSSGFAVDELISTEDVQSALSGETGVAIYTLAESQEKVMAVSSALRVNETTQAVLRYITSLREVDKIIAKIAFIALAIGCVIALAVFMVSVRFANSIVRPMKEIISGSSAMAEGSLDRRMKESYPHELGELARTLNYMAAEISKNEALKNDFISSISHELRTPLTSIKGWSETIASVDEHLEEDTRKGVEIIAKETERMIVLVEELLDFSKFQSQGLMIYKQRINLNDLLEDVLFQMETKARAKQISFAVHGEKEVLIDGDKQRLRQVFLNIVDNALKFSDTGTSIQLHIAIKDNAVQIDCIDQGEGIRAEHIPLVKKKFYQVYTNRGGTGLGLAICEEIIRLHEGILEIKSTFGEGTCVTITLPLPMLK